MPSTTNDKGGSVTIVDVEYVAYSGTVTAPALTIGDKVIANEAMIAYCRSRTPGNIAGEGYIRENNPAEPFLAVFQKADIDGSFFATPVDRQGLSINSSETGARVSILGEAIST